MIKVMIVEDSPVARDLLVYIFSSDPEIQVVGVAGNGMEAIEMAKQKRPDVITMDIHMPRMNGIEATRRIMETQPTPIVIVSASTSTGGPIALKTILSDLPQNLSVPLLIVQHIAMGFIGGFVEWLGGTSHFPLSIASHGEHPLPGHGYVAPDGFHLGVGSDTRIVLTDHAPENGLRPSVAYLFRSVAEVFGPNAVGVLLSGMGRDGAEELKIMKEKGAITIAQDRESSVVYGMPGEAIKLGAAKYVLPPEGIADILTTLMSDRKEKHP